MNYGGPLSRSCKFAPQIVRLNGMSVQGRRFASPPQSRWLLLHDFSVQCEIEPVALDFVGNPKANRHIDDLQDDQ
jgi:hypothetical protein